MDHVKLDDKLLEELGLDKFEEDEKNKILKKIYESLELRIGSRIAQKVSEEELKEFAEMTQSSQDQEAARWLKEKVPDYQQIAAEELENIKAEIKETSRKIMEKSFK